MSKIGTVNLPFNIVLKNVLYAPSFQCNLFSVPKYTSDTQTVMLFSGTKCHLLDLALMKVKEIGNFDSGLYKLTNKHLPMKSLFTPFVNSSCYASSSNSGALWHARLGHPSSATLRRLATILNNHDSVSYC